MDRFTARLGWLWIRRSHTVVSRIDVWSQSVIFLFRYFYQCWFLDRWVWLHRACIKYTSN